MYICPKQQLNVHECGSTVSLEHEFDQRQKIGAQLIILWFHHANVYINYLLVLTVQKNEDSLLRYHSMTVLLFRFSYFFLQTKPFLHVTNVKYYKRFAERFIQVYAVINSGVGNLKIFALNWCRK